MFGHYHPRSRATRIVVEVAAVSGAIYDICLVCPWLVESLLLLPRLDFRLCTPV